MIVALIPARLNSTRLKNKPLIKLNGVPLVIHVANKLKKCRKLSRIIICADDKKIVKIGKLNGYESVLTSRKHRNGTERINEVAKKIKSKLIIDVQCDAVFVDPKEIDKLIDFHFKNREFDIIIPHSKYKITKLKKKNLNPYFNNRLTDNSYNATAKLIPKCLFVISHGSTALSYAIINYKSVRFLYTKSYNLYDGTQDKDILLQAKILGAKTVDFATAKKKDLFKSLKVNKSKYDLYKYKFLTYKSKKLPKPIHKIIEDLMNQLFKKNKFKLQ